MYLNSCATIIVQGLVGLCMPGAAALAAVAALGGKAPRVALAMSVLSLVCTGAVAWITIAQQLSTIKAVVIYAGPTSWNKPKGAFVSSPLLINPQ